MWSALTQGVNLIRVAFTLILAKLVSPHDIGLVALGMSIIGFAQMFRDIGIHQAIIQKKDVTNLELSSVFWLTVFIGLGLAVSVCVASQFMLVSHKEENLAIVIIVLAFDIILRSVYQVPDALIRRNLNFKVFAIADFMGNLISGLSVIYLAYLGFGWIALVVRVLMSSLIVSITLFIYSKWTPKLKFSVDAVKPFFNFGIPIFVAGIFNYIKNQSDILLIGAFISIEELGYYQLALSFASILGSQFSYSIGRVYFPILSRLHEQNSAEFTNETIRFVGLTSSFLLIAAIYLTFGGADLLPLLMGKKWLGSKVLLPILAWGAVFQGSTICTSIILRATGNPKFELFGAIPSAIFTPLIIYIGLESYGILGAAFGFATSSFLTAILMIIFHLRIDKLSLKSYLGGMKHIFITLVITTIFGGISRIICVKYDDNLWLIIESVAMIAVVLIYLTYWRKK